MPRAAGLFVFIHIGVGFALLILFLRAMRRPEMRGKRQVAPLFLYMLVYRIYEHFKYKSDEYEKNSNAMRMALRHHVHACASAASD